MHQLRAKPERSGIFPSQELYFCKVVYLKNVINRNILELFINVTLMR